MNQTGDKQAHPMLGAADWISLGAAPTFAIMALLTGIHARGMPDPLCSAMQDASPLTAMVSMYLLMSAFHSAPWLKRIFGGGSIARRSSHNVLYRSRRQYFCAAARIVGIWIRRA
jgi:hypothetical protein